MKLRRPFFVSVEPAAVCQLHCPACPVGLRNHLSPITNHQSPPLQGRPGGASHFMSKEVWQRVLSEAAKTAYVMQFYFQGEPLLNKDLPAMIAEAHAAGLYTIVSTNAQALTPEMAEALVQSGLNRIIVSMDGLTEASYNAYRIGGSLEKVKAALRYLRAAKSSIKNNRQSIVHRQSSNRQSPLIELQCLRLKTNEHEWNTFKRQYKALGADRLTFKTAQLYDYADGHPLMPTDPRYSRYTKGADGRYHRKARVPWCLRVWSGVVITVTGDVLPCCYDKAHAYAYGNILESSLHELIHNDKARAFFRAAQHEIPDICKECWR